MLYFIQQVSLLKAKGLLLLKMLHFLQHFRGKRELACVMLYKVQQDTDDQANV